MHNRLTTDAKPVRMESGCGLGCLCLTALTAEYAVHHYPPGASPAAAQHEARPLHSGVHLPGTCRPSSRRMAHRHPCLFVFITGAVFCIRVVFVIHVVFITHVCSCASTRQHHSQWPPWDIKRSGGGGSYGVTHTTHAGPKSRKVGPACPDNRPGSGCRWILGGFTLIFRNMVRVMISALKIGPNFGTK